jgi:hypothetical protein
MSQIEITVLKQGQVSRNVLTCCLFTAGDSYRMLNQYVGNFKRFLKQSEVLKTFEVRVYTDDTAKDIVLEESASYPRVTVLHYNCPQFREGNGHVGMFGALVRFLPIFEDLDTVWSSDIDIPDRYLDPKLYRIVSEQGYDFLISTYSCYEMKVWGTKNTILAGRFISKIQFPRALLTLFLNRISAGKMDDIIEKINSGNTRKPRSEFPYGLDEHFLNTYIYNTLKTRNSKILLQKDYLDSGIVFKSDLKEEKDLLMKYYYFPTHERFLKIKKIILKYLPLYLDTHPCYRDTLENLHKMKNSFILMKKIQGSDL